MLMLYSITLIKWIEIISYLFTILIALGLELVLTTSSYCCICHSLYSFESFMIGRELSFLMCMKKYVVDITWGYCCNKETIRITKQVWMNSNIWSIITKDQIVCEKEEYRQWNKHKSTCEVRVCQSLSGRSLCSSIGEIK